MVEEGANATRGYLQVSVCALGPDDQAEEWNTDINVDDKDFLSKVMVPPSITLETRWVIATIYQAEDLPRTASSAITGFRVQMSAGNISVKTKRRKPPQALLGAATAPAGGLNISSESATAAWSSSSGKSPDTTAKPVSCHCRSWAAVRLPSDGLTGDGLIHLVSGGRLPSGSGDDTAAVAAASMVEGHAT